MKLDTCPSCGSHDATGGLCDYCGGRVAAPPVPAAKPRPRRGGSGLWRDVHALSLVGLCFLALLGYVIYARSPVRVVERVHLVERAHVPKPQPKRAWRPPPAGIQVQGRSARWDLDRRAEDFFTGKN